MNRTLHHHPPSQQKLEGDVKKCFLHFLQNHLDEKNNLKYVQKGRKMIEEGIHLMVVSTNEFMIYDDGLASVVFEEYYRYERVINLALSSFMWEQEKFLGLGMGKAEEESKEHYEVTFDSSNSASVLGLRDLRCDRLGRLVSVRATITRTSEVRPELTVGVFKCTTCGSYSRPIQQQFKYTEPKKCLRSNCDKQGWELDLSKSEFADFQKIRVQEDPSRIPPGSMPRSLDIVVRNDNSEKGQPGDICTFVGYLCVLPDISSMLKAGQRLTFSSRSLMVRGDMGQMEGITGLKGTKQLNYKMIFIGTNISVENNKFSSEIEGEDDDQEENKVHHEFSEEKILNTILQNMQETEVKTLMELRDSNTLYEDMANSLFPSIFGQLEIKKSLLLQLIGGINKQTANKVNIRGDINILIVGDPSTAKSQFLKCVSGFVPRSVFTNGKTTSAAGLTASVVRDENGSVGIEAGALMLADNGICCIDEFEKMDLKDQVAIHEAMEQQTISIAKAGVYATLNARTSILAAANPIFGRYDKSKSLKNNINISAPIMSRFDLFFIICDEANTLIDSHLSQFMISTHRNPTTIHGKYDAKTIKLYISTVRKLKPMITVEAAQLLRRFYGELREKDKGTQNTAYRVTVRQLESMIRLSEAYARLRMDTYVIPSDVKEAYQLISTSLMKLEKPPIELVGDFDEKYERELINKAILEKDLKKKEKINRNKSISISHEFYQQVRKNTLSFFEECSQVQKKITHQDLISYLLSMNFEGISSEHQSSQLRKILNAVIKKFIREERILMIEEDNIDTKLRILSIHPNFIE